MNNTALVIIDMVKDFTDPEGLVFYPQNREILPRIKRVLEECRKHGILVIFLQHSYRSGKYDKNLANMRPNCIEGTGGDAIDPMLEVDPVRDYVIKKRRYSGFVGTDLDMVLRENGIKNLIITGTKTNCCIRATVTDAYNLDYIPIVVSDCVATNDETVNQVHLSDIKKYLGKVVTSQELFDNLDKGGII
ncbi:cysteine hydrolase family protein [Ruminiclostridium cellobioparum]|uniref:cysteine hydrolase family protein n=1 Tax=Ruminiclostridium cellobioparum TaxID=29355 RepID=UPI0004805FD2|nr:isochorismatase family cysteine hydrolase [Ruminiclostridium cellobioparum]